MAQQTWELENNIVTMETPSSSESDADEASQAKSQQDKPWSTDPHFFKRLKISALFSQDGRPRSLRRHHRSHGIPSSSWTLSLCPLRGLRLGLMLRLTLMSVWLIILRLTSRWGGWRMWLGGTILTLVMDAGFLVLTSLVQMLNQQFQEPFLAVVIDPTRTVSAGKVEIGAFRTYPQGYKPADEPVSEYQTIPLSKIEDFGAHCKQVDLFSQLPLSSSYFFFVLFIGHHIFQSSLDHHLLDLLWNKYWVNTLSSSPLLGNKDYFAEQLSDLAEKLEQAENQLAHSHFAPLIAPSQKKKEEESQLAEITRDSAKITVEQVHGLMSQAIKDILFNSVHHLNRPHTELSGSEPMVES